MLDWQLELGYEVMHYWNNFVLFKSFWTKYNFFHQEYILHSCHLSILVLVERFDFLRIIVALISAVFPLFALLPFLSFSVSLFIYLLFLLMVISNLICIQITSPGGTPIRGKNAGYRKCLLILLTPPSPPFPLSSSSFHLSVSPSPALCPLHLLRHFFCLYHLTVQRCVWSWKRQKQETGSHLHTCENCSLIKSPIIVYFNNLATDIPPSLQATVG